MLKVIEFFSSDNKENWLRQMEACDWRAGQWLGELLRAGELQELTGANTLVAMAVDGDKLASFCTLAPLDEIQPTELTPWIGFVYTFPQYRGQRAAGLVLDWCESIATIMGHEAVYISTDHVGLYEKYGYSFLRMEKTPSGEECRVYRKLLQKDGPEKDEQMEADGI